MKHILTIVFSLSYCFVLSQSNYYWSDNKKNYLSVDSSEFVIQIDANVDITSLSTQLMTNSGVLKLEEKSFGGKRALILKCSNRNFKNFSSLVKSSFPNAKDAYPIYKIGETSFYPTNRIVLQPKAGVSIESILRQFKSKNIELLKSSKWGSHLIEVKKVSALLSVANEIYESGLVEWCHPDFIVEIVKTNDPLYTEQYYLNNTGQFGGTTGIDINAPEAWQVTTGNSSIRVAVIDDGVEDHEDLSGRVMTGFTPLTNGTGAPSISSNGHGEACAGIIAASHDNFTGIRGVAPNVMIVPVNIFAGSESTADLAEAINWAWDPNLGNADILSNSWGFNTTSQTAAGFDAIIQAITNARTFGRENRGSIVVFASGNSNQSFSGVTFPANVNGVITVGAINKSGVIWNYSSRGSQMDLVAPTGNVNLAGDVRTTDRMNSNGFETGNYTTRFGGTSAACPQVSGVAALMLSVNTSLTETQVRTMLRSTATDMGISCFDNTFGSGRVNAQAAVNAALSSISSFAVCSANTNPLVLSSSLTGTTTWQASPSSLFQTSTGTGTSALLRPSSTSVSGAATLTFTINNSCNSTTTVTTSVWVGIPETPTTVLGSTSPSYNSNQIYFINFPPNGYSSLDWELPPPPSCPAPPVNATFGPCVQWSSDGNENTTNLNAKVGSVNGYVRVRGFNQCGSGAYSSLFVSVPSSSVTSIYCPCGYNAGGGTPMAAMIYPNPSSTELNIDFTQIEGSTDRYTEQFTESYEVTLQSETLTPLYSKSTKERFMKIPTASLPNGLYYLTIKNQSGTYSHHIQIKH